MGMGIDHPRHDCEAFQIIAAVILEIGIMLETVTYRHDAITRYRHRIHLQAVCLRVDAAVVE
jgi:hypothetical protein